MNKISSQLATLAVAATLGIAGTAQAQTTLKKVQDTGEIVMGVRESSSPLSFTLGFGMGPSLPPFQVPPPPPGPWPPVPGQLPPSNCSSIPTPPRRREANCFRTGLTS